MAPSSISPPVKVCRGTGCQARDPHDQDTFLTVKLNMYLLLGGDGEDEAPLERDMIPLEHISMLGSELGRGDFFF